MATLSAATGQASSSSSSSSALPSTNAPPRLVAPAPRRPIALVSKQHRTLHKHSRHQSYHHSHHLAQHRGHHLHHSASASFDAGRQGGGGGGGGGDAPLADQLNALSLLGESSQQQQHYPERVQSAGVLGYHARDEDLQGQDPSSYLDPDLTPTKARLQSMKQAMGGGDQLLSPSALGSIQPPLSSPLAHKSTAAPAPGNLLWPGAVAMQEAVGMPLNDEHDDEMVGDDEEEQRRQLYRQQQQQQQQQPQREMPGASYFAFLHSDNDYYHHSQEREQDTTSHLFQHDNASAAASTLSTTIPHGFGHGEAAAASSSTTPPATPSPSVAAGLEAARMHSAGARLPSSPISRLHTRNPFGRAASYEG